MAFLSGKVPLFSLKCLAISHLPISNSCSFQQMFQETGLAKEFQMNLRCRYCHRVTSLDCSLLQTHDFCQSKGPLFRGRSRELCLRLLLIADRCRRLYCQSQSSALQSHVSHRGPKLRLNCSSDVDFSLNYSI